MFCLYIGYDVHRSQQFAKTLDNAVDCALDIYLDIANLFLRLLRLLSRKNK
jgi:FtsH-binding integral membrane protein